MTCCLNPDCPNPLNLVGKHSCQSCGTPLVLLLRNRFRVVRVLSDEGGFGRTYLAEDVDKLNERCVIKQLAPKFQGNWALTKAMELFQKEAQRLQQLGEHPQIPRLLAYFEEDNYLYLVQQFIDGQNLLKELQQKKAYSAVEIQELLLDLLPVVKFIHERGVIHRDIKPQNIIYRKSDRRFCLIDFGSSKQLTARVQIKSRTTIGSHGYSPIEQIKDGAAYPASDLFSLGATCFHLLTGISPFQLWMEHGYGWVQDWRRYLRSPMSSQLDQVLDKLLKKDPQQRYQSANEAIRELTPQPLLSSRGSTRFPITPPPTQLHLPRQHAKLRNLLLSGTAILLLGSGKFWYHQYLRFETRMDAIISQLDDRPANTEAILGQPLKTPLEKFSLAYTFNGHSKSVLSVAISPDAKTIVSNSDDTIKLWSLATKQEICVLNGHSNRVNVVAISPDGKILASGSEDNTIKLWNLATGQQMQTLEGHSDSIHTLTFTPNSKTLVSGSDDKTIKLWNLETGEVIRTLTGHSSWVRSVALSPDGKTLVSSSFDKTIKVWDLATSKLMRTLLEPNGKETSIAISPDGKTLASVGFDKTINLWNLATGLPIRTLAGHSGNVTSVAFSPDGQTLASGSFDKTIKLWNKTSGQPIRTLVGHEDSVDAIAFSQDGKILISGSEDNTIKIWLVSRD
ncbi:MAG: serine/threonine protein kinase [Stigonema ocellatum SAG 48.90 = DSM 106950]|nr:serine/threonine protein kinase [Stigonema ocellatum SAG 48.90 = DSM 106950]